MAKAMIDVKLNSEGDLDVVDGDLCEEESTQHHWKDLILDAPGEEGVAPGMGVGAFGYLDDEDGLNGLMGEITKELVADGVAVKSVALGANGVVNVNGEYR